ncbi:CDP-diacylglycerol--glycerol-3-phosphate 3-phosphatidyltransferase [Arenicella chitinivorans]|uniref:CDP-diacylglycerol--glycerol-3-phosphate 3-phosphatidyltransferase n=1 Tax=Arenicella chitinivorans TaxID=1329800 RepID=A0A918VQ86_9GAMM|nr:CDP-diacylglycerol--glycerol-3-phosphate 3-phosphatidyltransferase [Arenicella chitinivorans]
MSLTIPNCLTLFRIIAIPLIAIIYFSDVRFGNWYCTIIFTLAGISDALDGYLARKWNQTSKLGAFLDPVADKLLVSTMLLLVVSNVELQRGLLNELLFIITVIIIISREITVSALREWMAEIGKRANVAVSVVGKYKTGIQMGAIGCLLFQHDFIGLPILLIGELMLYAAGVLTIWSMSIYLRAAYKAVQHD